MSWRTAAAKPTAAKQVPRTSAATNRCAIYTRKSSEEGLEQEFNSLDTRRESGENYIASQAGEGWVCLPDRYDDGGFTGGNMERPALQAPHGRHRVGARSTAWSSTKSIDSAGRCSPSPE